MKSVFVRHSPVHASQPMFLLSIIHHNHFPYWWPDFGYLRYHFVSINLNLTIDICQFDWKLVAMHALNIFDWILNGQNATLEIWWEKNSNKTKCDAYCRFQAKFKSISFRSGISLISIWNPLVSFAATKAVRAVRHFSVYIKLASYYLLCSQWILSQSLQHFIHSLPFEWQFGLFPTCNINICNRFSY